MSFRREYRVAGKDNYVIDFVAKNGKWELVPRLFPKNTGSNRDAHLNGDGTICVAKGLDGKMADGSFAVAVAKAWAAGYSEYIRSGHFPNEGGKVQV